ncbi:hypothetical protein CAEBREN_22097 [Caenorhabditis brenneri]|uniref:Uncharacterized protein n=1 Tax=Caenorhabditis brenneri TaxID=135651 RepID=G0PA83_CAEBE|nr:hypothetical protein CAEBREN_22097 [Caenorhabditis brenneri]
MLNQIWANVKNTAKEQFRTKSIELHHAFRKKFPEIVVQTVDYDPYFGMELQRHKRLLNEKEVATKYMETSTLQSTEFRSWKSNKLPMSLLRKMST